MSNIAQQSPEPTVVERFTKFVAVAKEMLAASRQDETGVEKGDLIILKAKRMKALSDIYDLVKPLLSEVNDEFDVIRLKSLPDAMAEAEVASLVIEGVGRVQLAGDVYASILAEDKDAAFEWLRGNNYGDLIKETVASGTLKSWAKECTENGVDLPQIFKVTPFSRASIVKVAAKKTAVKKSKTADA